MENEHYLEDLAEIKNIMERSSRFISLSGLSGVLAGVYAIVGAYIAWGLLYDFDDYFSRELVTYLPSATLFYLFLDGAIVLALSLLTGAVLTQRRANKQGRDVWDQTSKRLVINLAIPLLAGGVFLLLLLSKGFVGIVAPGTLIFYGLALINSGKYTVRDIRVLGMFEVLLGLVATWDMGHGLFYWAIGFGVFHIIYGIMMYVKYERNE